MSKSLQTRRARTSLIDAEWDWIANRLTERGGRWALPSFVNPSLARIAYAPSGTRRVAGVPSVCGLPAPEQSPTWKSTDLTPSLPPAATTGRLSVIAVLLTAVVGLTVGVLLHRATSGLNERWSVASPSTVPVAGAHAHVDAQGLERRLASVEATTSAPSATAPEPTSPTASTGESRQAAPRSRPRARARPSLSGSARKPAAQSDNPY